MVALAACAAPGSEIGKSSDDGPLKIGFIAGLTGTAAGPAADMRAGFELYWDQVGHKSSGRDVELFVEDDEGDPEAGLAAARRLVEKEDVDVIVGPHFANVGLAVAQYLADQDVAMIYPIPASSEFLTHPIDTMFLAGGTAAQFTYPLGKWAAQQDAKTALTISSDYTFGHEIAGGFTDTFTKYGGTVKKQMWPPLGTTDYGPFVSQIAAGDYDVVFDGLQGEDAVAFQQAWNDYGLAKDGPKLVASPSTMDQSLLRTMADTSKGVISTGHFAEGRDKGVTADFVKKFEADNDSVPGYYAASGFFGAQLADAGIKELDGRIPDAKSFIDAVSDVHMDDSVFGPVQVDEHGNINLDVYLREVTKREGGGYWNTVMDVFPSVAPEFEFDYDAFLKMPPYSRGFQGVDTH